MRVYDYGIGEKDEKYKVYYPRYNFFEKNFDLVTYTFYSKRELENQLPEILDYFKSKLKNDHIKIKINTTNSIKKNILFTASEKFQKLAELNPSIKKLKKKLDLDY